MAERTDAVCESEPVLKERRRAVGIVLQVLGVARLVGNREVADVLDRIATDLEHPEKAIQS